MYTKYLTLLHSEQPKLYGVLAILSAIGFKIQSKLKKELMSQGMHYQPLLKIA